VAPVAQTTDLVDVVATNADLGAVLRSIGEWPSSRGR